MTEKRSSQRFHSLNAEQVEILDQVLSEVVPIHGRGNFPTLELRPRDIIMAVRARLETQGILVRDVRLNGSTASHVLVRDNGTSYKDLDIIFGVELPKQEDFQVIKESVLACLLDCLPVGVNRERISSATMKEAYVQKMVKVFNEHDRWSLISLSNNSGKNLELKFVSALRRQFEFSVDSFQIILDRLLESYLQLEAQQLENRLDLESGAPDNQSKDCPSPSNPAAEKRDSMITDSQNLSGTEGVQAKGSNYSDHTQHPQETEPLPELPKEEEEEEVREQTELQVQETSTEEPREDVEQPSETDFAEEISVGDCLENKQLPDDTELNHQTELLHQCSLKIKPLAQTQLRVDDVYDDDSKQVERSEHKELSDPIEVSVENESSNDRESLSEHEKKGIHPFDPVKDSIPGETECLDTAEQMHNNESTDEILVTECSSEEKKRNTDDDTQQLCVSDTSQANDSEIEILPQLEGDGENDSKAETQMQTERETNTETTTQQDPIRETTGVETTSAIESPCSSTSLPLTQSSVARPTPETHSPLHTDSAEHTAKAVDPVNPTETQDIVSTQASLLSDKNISCLPSSKAANRLAQMVVLKHSSPKPPRRMCRKVTTSPIASPIFGTETVIPAPDLEAYPSLSEQETAPELDESRVPSASEDIKSTATDNMPGEVHCSEESAFSSLTSPDPNPETHLSAPDPPPDLDPLSNVESFSPSTGEPQTSQITEGLSETPTLELKETLPSEVACDDQSQIESSPNLLSQSEPPDSRDTLASSDSDRCCTPTHDPLLTSVAELSDDEATTEGPDEMVDLGPSMDLVCISLSLPVGEQSASSSPPSFHTASPSGSCLTPPMHCLSPPCATPTSPGLTPPLCLSPPPQCLTSPMLSISPPSSFSSTPLSFSPTSSGLSSPPYLTPPMLSLSPPPLCHSPPLLCLTPPVESEAPVSQVMPELGPLVQNTEAEQSSPPPAVPLLSSPDDKDGDAVLSQTLVPEPVLFPISEAQAITPPGETPVDTDPPNANDLSTPKPRSQEDALPRGASSDTPRQSKPPQLSGKVPAVEVLAESMYGDFEAAMDHLRYRLIATRNPEEIRGGGLLKYSNLLVRDYRPASETQIKTLERYMCSRFFIDFPDVQEQQRKILSYLKNHFIGEERSKYQYLMTLRRVVDDSTVCLMGHERRQTLNMITVLALKVLGEQNIIPNTDHVTCFYQPAPYLAEHSAPYLAEPSYCSYYIPQGGSTLLYQPYPLHLHTQTGLV